MCCCCNVTQPWRLFRAGADSGRGSYRGYFARTPPIENSRSSVESSRTQIVNILPRYVMISLEQWRAAVGGWNAGKLSAIYRRYGSRRIVRNWAKLLLVMDSYTAVIFYALYWLIAGLFAFMSSDGWIIALSVVFDDACGYPHDIRRALVESPTATVFHVSREYLQRFWVFASPTVAPLLRSCMIRLQRLWKLASPSVSSMLRLLLALNWLLIVAGDVELNPGPVSQGEV